MEFHLLVDAPLSPPALQLIGNGSARPVVGRLYTADWQAIDASKTVKPSTPVPWPLAVPSGGFATLEFLSEAAPAFASMNAFRTVHTVSGVPVDETQSVTDTPEIYLECPAFAGDDFMEKSAGGTALWSGIPSSVFKYEYLTVFASWPVAPDPSTGKGPDVVAASWLFRISGCRDTPSGCGAEGVIDDRRRSLEP